MWNGPINGDWSNVKFNEAPWNNEICPLEHEEVLFVINELPSIEAQYLPDANMVVSKFNALTEWEKCINGITYSTVKSYNPEVNLLGINTAGIIQPEPVEELPEEPPVEEVPEEQPVEEPEAPVEEPVTEEEPVVE